MSSPGSWSTQINGAYGSGGTFDAAVDALAEVVAYKVCAVCGGGDGEEVQWMRANRAEIMRRLGLTADGQARGE